MSGINLTYASQPVHTPSDFWLAKSKEERIDLIKHFFKQNDVPMDVVRIENDSDIIVKLNSKLDAAQRGELLRDVEFQLNEKIEKSISIWLGMQADRNTIRHFRGVKIDVKQER
jgi:hypothetical protein